MGHQRWRVDGYIRVSSVGGRSGERFISPRLQREEIERRVARHDAELLSVFEELNQSGRRRHGSDGRCRDRGRRRLGLGDEEGLPRGRERVERAAVARVEHVGAVRGAVARVDE